MEELEKLVREKLSVADAGHDWWHAVRVRDNALKIAGTEGGNLKVIETAALVHDLVDEKLFDTEKARKELKAFLQESGLSPEDVSHVINIISYMSFSKELDGAGFDSLEFRIVQDADRLDAIGAIGIARTFSYGAHKGRPFYDPEIPFEEVTTKQDYRNRETPTINHFYEKLLLLKDMMKTPTGRKLAEERHLFMEQFLAQFFKEWNGE